MQRSHSTLALAALATLTVAVALACGRSGIPSDGAGGDDDDDGATVRTLTVLVQGNGRPYSRVRSVPAGISCPGDCTEDFPRDTAVTLTASSGTATFIDWKGACATSTGPDCPLVLSSNLNAVARLATSGSVVWAQLFADNGGAIGEAVLVATNGDAVSAGSFQGSATRFGDDACTLATAGGSDVFVARHTPSGACVWASRMGGSDDDRLSDLAGSDGGLFAVRGEFLSPVFDTTGGDLAKSGAGTDAFTVLMTGEAKVLWAMPSPEPNRRSGITACFGTGDLLFAADEVDANNDGNRNVHYYRIATGGAGTVTSARQTTKNGGGNFDPFPQASACAASGLLLTGVHDPGTGQGLSFPGGGALSVNGAASVPDDVWLARISTGGTFDVSWTQRFGGAGNQDNPSIAARNDGQLLVAIDVDAVTSIGGASVGGATVVVPAASIDGARDILMARLDANGAVQRTRVYGTAGNQSVSSVAFADDLGETLIAGQFDAAFELAAKTPAGDDIFIARLSSSGTPVWQRNFGGANDDEVRSVAIRGGFLYLTGALAGSAPFPVETFVGPVTLDPEGGSDVLLMRLVP